MKRKLILFLFLLSLAVLTACTAAVTSSVESSTLPPTTTEAPYTTDENGLIVLPDDYYAEPDRVYSASKIVIPAEYNQGLAVDIRPILSGGKAYFLLPSAVKLEQVVYHLINADGSLIAGRCGDFTNEGATGKKVKMLGSTYEIYVIRSDSPTLYLEIDETYGTIEDVKADSSKETRAYGSFILECREDIAEKYGWQTHYESTENDPDSPCTAYIKGRGNYTWNKTEKQGYSIKLEKKADLLGMGKSKKWALVGNMTDPTMLRNSLAYYLGESAGLDYTPEGELVDFFVNGEYFGAFVLTEKIDVEEERVNIRDLEKEIEALDPAQNNGRQQKKTVNGIQLKYYSGVENPEDITGGYIIEMEMQERYENEPCGFRTTQGNYYVIKTPEYVSYEQALYIATLVDNMEKAVYSTSGKHPTTAKPYTDYIDLDSLVRKYLVDEISKNYDGAKTSHYLYKPADSQSDKLYCGPVWDYDIAFGIRPETVNPEGWYAKSEKTFYKKCWQHTNFKAAVKSAYLEEFLPAINTYLTEMIKTEAERNEKSLMMNELLYKQFTQKSYDRHVSELESYLKKRAAWLTEQFNKL